MTTTTAIRVIVPYCPPRALWPNQTPNRYAKGKVVKKVRSDVCLLGQAAHGYNPPMLAGEVEVRVVIGWPKGQRSLDTENARSSLKAHIDGLTDAGFWRSDHRVKVVECEQVLWSKQDAGTQAMYPHGFTSFEIQEAGA